MKLLRYVLLLAGLLAGSLGSANAQVFEWSKLARNLGIGTTNTRTATTDLNGNTYTSLRFRDSVRVGGTRITTAGYGELLVKYDSIGHVTWTKLIRGITFEQGGLKVNPVTGDLFISGRLLPGANWDGTAVPGGGLNTYFYGKCSPTGALLWLNPRPFMAGPALAADNLGNCYIIGRTTATGLIGGQGVDSTSLALFKVNGAGTVEWLRKMRGGRPPGPGAGGFGLGMSGSFGLGPQPGGGVLVFGQFTSSLYYGTGTTPVQTSTTQTPTNFIANIGASGNLAWSRQSGGVVTAAATDAAGNYYVTGSFPVISPAMPPTPQNGIGVVKYDGAGTQVWVRTQQPLSTNTESGRMLVVDGAGNVTVVADGNPQGGSSATVVGTLVLRARANVLRINAQGQAQWVANDWWSGPTRSSNPYVEAVNIGLDRQGNVYYTTNISGDSLRGPQPVVQFGSHTLVGSGVAVSRIGSQHNSITGTLYLDQNGNGVRDAGEGPFPIPLVLEATQPNFSAVATPDASGSYRLYTDRGTYTELVPQVPANYAVSQPGAGSYTGSFAGYGNLDSARHVGVRPLVNQTDLRATLTPYGAVRPGFTTRYRLTLENVGTTTVPAGTATVTLDTRALYVASSLPTTVSGRVISWNYTAMLPFARRELDVTFSLPTNATLGAVLATTAAAAVTGDITPADNSATYNHTVTGSYDPNDIEVNFPRLTPAQVAARQPLDYTVRFQNMGTDTAFTVVISDTLDFRKLDVASLRLVAQSHNCMWSLSGTSLLTVRFLNIKLPHRNVDVIRSQGFVRFRVLPRTTLAVGEVIPNHAGIVFDYNSPVLTNTATTTVFVATAALARREAPAWDAYPNPATDAITVAADLPTAGLVRAELLDVLGRPVRQQTLTAPAGALRLTTDLRGLASGVYMLRLTPPTGPASTRQVVRE